MKVERWVMIIRWHGIMIMMVVVHSILSLVILKSLMLIQIISNIFLGGIQYAIGENKKIIQKQKLNFLPIQNHLQKRSFQLVNSLSQQK